MGGLDALMVFDDGEEDVKPQPKPKAKTKPRAKSKPKPQPKKEVSVVVEVEEEDETLPPQDTYETEEILKSFFDKRDRIGKDGMVIYEGKKTFLGAKIKSTDKIIEFALINAQSADTSKFISISFKKMTEKEIKKIAKQYQVIGEPKRYPQLVDRKYMVLGKYKSIKTRVLDDFR